VDPATVPPARQGGGGVLGVNDEERQTPVPQLRGGASAPHNHLGIPLSGGFPADSSCRAREAIKTHIVSKVRRAAAVRFGGTRTLPQKETSLGFFVFVAIRLVRPIAPKCRHDGTGGKADLIRIALQ